MNLKTLTLLTLWLWIFSNTLIIFLGVKIGVGYEAIRDVVIMDSIILLGFIVSIAITTKGDR